MGKHKKRKLDADRAYLDDQDKASFFCPPKKRNKKKSKSTSDHELELSSSEAYDEVYQAQSNLSTAHLPNTSNYTSTLRVGLNNDTERYPLSFDMIEYQSYDIFDKKIRALLEIYSSASLLLTYEQEKDCRVNILRLQIFYIGIWP